jgi:hypothetical protein
MAGNLAGWKESNSGCCDAGVPSPRRDEPRSQSRTIGRRTGYRPEAREASHRTV